MNDGNESLTINQSNLPSAATSDSALVQRVTGALPSGNAVAWLASQVPEFVVLKKRANLDPKNGSSGAGALDGVSLLADSSKLTKSTKRWYEIQTGAAMESWSSLKAEMEKIFDRKISFYKAMQKVEARKWNVMKEIFD